MTKQRKRSSRKHDLIKRFINDRIQRGIYTGKLPGVSKLAQEFDVNSQTVNRAFDSLAEEGIVERRSRVGTFVIRKKRIAVLSLNQKNRILKAHNFDVPPIFQTMLASLENAACENNLQLLPYATDIKDREFINFIKGEVDGLVLLLAPHFDEDCLEIFDGVPWVKVMGETFKSAQGNIVTYDNSLIGKLAAESLIRQECERFYYIGGVDRNLFKERFDVFNATLKQAGFKGELVELDIRKLLIGELLDKAEKYFKKIFVSEAPRSGLFLSADIYGVPIYQKLYSMGLKPVEDVPIVSCDNNKLVLYGLYPKPEVIDIRLADIGVRAIDVLMNCFKEQADKKAEKVVLEPVLLHS